jgi:hypothetical protein
MSRSTRVRAALSVLGVVAMTLLIVGCFESKYPLANRPPAHRVDAKYLGDWTLEQLDQDGQTNTSKLFVRNLRGEEYFVEWVADQDEDRFRAVAYLTDVGGVTFANISALTDTAQPADKYTILRVDMDGAKLKLQNLDPEFFKDKPFDSPDALRKIVADNLHNEKMYRGEPLFGTKTK